MMTGSEIFGLLVACAIGGTFGGFLVFMGTDNIWLSVFAALISMSFLSIGGTLDSIRVTAEHIRRSIEKEA